MDKNKQFFYCLFSKIAYSFFQLPIAYFFKIAY